MRGSAAFLIVCLSACSGEQATRVTATDISFQQEAHPLAGKIWDVAAGREIEVDGLVSGLGAADIAVLGEVHDNPRHHERQATLVAALEPDGIAFEMIPTGSEEGIAVFREQGGEAEDIGPAIGWNRLGWPDWALYAPIFAAAPDAVVTGGASPIGDLKTAIRSGAATAFGTGAEIYGLQVKPGPVLQKALEDEMIAAHCNKLPRVAATGMTEAQRLRDARFAAAVERARQQGAGKTVLITGNGHARTDRGVPAYLELSLPQANVASLGQIEVVEGVDAPQDYAEDGALLYDYIWFSARLDRPDPCESFN